MTTPLTAAEVAEPQALCDERRAYLRMLCFRVGRGQTLSLDTAEVLALLAASEPIVATTSDQVREWRNMDDTGLRMRAEQLAASAAGNVSRRGKAVRDQARLTLSMLLQRRALLDRVAELERERAPRDAQYLPTSDATRKAAHGT